MKYAKHAGWVVTALVLLYAGRERLAADRLDARSRSPYENTAAAPDKPAEVGGFFDAHTSTDVVQLQKDAWIDYALDTFPPSQPDATGPRKSAAPERHPLPLSSAPAPFRWLDTHSNPSLVKEGVGGKAHARRGAGVLIDSQNRRWEIEPRRSTDTAAAAQASPGEDEEPTRPPVDPALVARRRDNSRLALKCAGAAAAALLLW
jgi:hypothetical protein